jgi:sugar lactone lactonase YvrE
MKKLSSFFCILVFNSYFAQVVTTFAGSGLPGSIDATGTAASFRGPNGMCIDALGNIYVADASNNKIRKITPFKVVTTLAGSGIAGSIDASGSAASFSYPRGVCCDAAGNVYVADGGNHKIRKITPAGVVTTFAGSGSIGSIDGTGTASSFYAPIGICSDALGNIYVADGANSNIRKITPSGVVTTFAGSSGMLGSADGNGSAASFRGPIGICSDSKGNIYVADFGNYKIRKITPGGNVTTLAGSGTSGSADGTGASASFKNTHAVCSDTSGHIYVADYQDNKIRKITPGGVVTTFAGTGIEGSKDTIWSSASFSYPSGVTSDVVGNIYVADAGNLKIRKISSSTSNPLALMALSKNTFKLSIYPNLSHDGKISLILNNVGIQTLEFKIFDIMGNTITRFQENYKTSEVSHPLDLSYLSNGNYYLLVSNGSESHFVKFTISK